MVRAVAVAHQFKTPDAHGAPLSRLSGGEPLHHWRLERQDALHIGYIWTARTNLHLALAPAQGFKDGFHVQRLSRKAGAEAADIRRDRVRPLSAIPDRCAPDKRAGHVAEP